MKKRAQSILEYAVLIGLISAALVGMQLYYKRGIQAAVKLAADEMGEQKKGALDYDYRYEWKIKGNTETTTVAEGTTTTKQAQGGAVTYGKDETIQQEGILSWGLWRERE